MLTRKRSLVLAIAATLWLPVSLFINPGWAGILIVSPVVLITIVPMLVPLANRSGDEPLTIVDTCLQLAFYLCWFAVGFFFVNSGDTDGSTRSIFTRLVASTTDRDYRHLLDVSNQLSAESLYAATALLVAIVGMAAVRRARRARSGQTGSPARQRPTSSGLPS